MLQLSIRAGTSSRAAWRLLLRFSGAEQYRQEDGKGDTEAVAWALAGGPGKTAGLSSAQDPSMRPKSASHP